MRKDRGMMKNKPLVIGGVVVLLLVVAVIRFRAQQSSITPPPLPEPTQQSTPAEVSGEPTPTPIPSTKPTAKMTLTVSSPTNGSTVTKPSIKVQGKTLPNAEVFVNENETKADKNGNFSVSMDLDEGENYIIVMANDEDGNVAEVELTVTYDSG